MQKFGFYMNLTVRKRFIEAFICHMSPVCFEVVAFMPTAWVKAGCKYYIIDANEDIFDQRHMESTSSQPTPVSV